jgi:hypothetical protein
MLATVLPVFFVWQVLLDPRVGSPLVFAMSFVEVRQRKSAFRVGFAWEGRQKFSRHMQTTAILGKMAIKWPDQTREFFDVIAVVNFNTEMFRLECILGRSQPIKAAILTAISPAVVYFLGVLVFALSRCVAYLKARLLTASEHNEAASDDAGKLFENFTKGKVYLHFHPREFLAVATWSQYLRLLAVVKPLRIAPKWPLYVAPTCMNAMAFTHAHSSCRRTCV